RTRFAGSPSAIPVKSVKSRTLPRRSKVAQLRGDLRVQDLSYAASPPPMSASGPASARPLSYREAGVDIGAGDALVERIKPFAKRTLRPEVLAGIGGFGALVELPKRYREPVLVAGTDGVGTKLKLA